jgi:hypothetical protein
MCPARAPDLAHLDEDKIERIRNVHQCLAWGEAYQKSPRLI